MKNSLDELLDVNSYDPDGKLKFPGKIIAATPKDRSQSFRNMPTTPT